MGFLNLSALVLLSLRALTAFADTEPVVEGKKEEPTVPPNLQIQVSTSFPSSEIFGVKLVNGHATEALLSFTNNEPAPVTVAMVGGALLTLRELPPGTPTYAGILRNLTSIRYRLEVAPGGHETLPYHFATDLMPQDLRLQIAAVVQSAEGNAYQINAYNKTVSVVEPETSLFDPQIIFLYLVLVAVFGGTVYFIYTTWISTLFPQKRRGGKGGDRSKYSARGAKKAGDAAEQLSDGAEGTATTTGAKGYDESWIPEHHLSRPDARRVKGGTPARTKSRGKGE